MKVKVSWELREIVLKLKEN